MLFNSFTFLLFLPIVFILYWGVASKSLRFRNIFILVCSYVFYGWWDWRFLFLILFSSIVDFFVGLKIEGANSKRAAKSWLYGSLIINLGLLGVFKYYDFFITSWIDLMNTVGVQANVRTLQLILPVGISFYTFQTLSYSIDIYKGKMKATKDFVAFAAFVSFFPQLVAGPIERASNLLPQFNFIKKFDYATAVLGLRLILWGFFKKVVVADNCAVVVNQIFEQYDTLGSLDLFIGAVLFSFQIYGDFSGYSDIAIGTAHLLGVKLMTNFKTPYFSRDIAEFWRRWHISLSTWFRDYVYIPLGGSKNGKYRALKNTLIVFLVSGFWHGANFTFIFWGLFNALLFLPKMIRGKNRVYLDVIAKGKLLPSLWEFLLVLKTFVIVSLVWVFFRSQTITDAFLFLKNIFLLTGIGGIKVGVGLKVIVPICLLLLGDWIFLRDIQHQFFVEKKFMWLRWVSYVLLLFIIFTMGAFNKQEFIYFTF